MDLNIYLVLFGIITFANGKPASDETSFLIASENELQSLLKSLYSQGKFDIAFSHHEDGPKIHHEDSARFTPHEDKHHHHHQSSHESHSHHDHHGNHKHTNVEEHPSLTNIQTLNLFYRKKPANGVKLSDSSSNDDSDISNILGLNKKHIARTVDNDVDDVLNFLKELDNNFEEERCEGDRCGTNRDMCVGDRCSRGRSDNRDNECRGNRCSNERACVGDRCGRDRDDDDIRDDNCVGDRCDRVRDGDRACVGDRCGRDRDDDNDRACVGDRCGRDRDDDNDRACVGDRCGRAGDDENDRDNNLRCIGDRCEDDRACIGDRCGRAIFINNDDDEDDNNNNNLLRCVGDRCERTDDRADCTGDRCGCPGDRCGDRNDLRNRRLPNGDEHIKRQLLQKQFGNKIKINDNLDAIVLDITDLEKSLGRPHLKQSDNQQATLQLIENVELDNLLDDNRGLNSKQPIEAIVVDLNRGQNDLSREINNLVADLQMPVKKQKRFSSLKMPPSKPKGEAKIVSHNEENNNVYVPKWLLDEVAMKTAGKSNLRDPLEHTLNNALPLTSKQKERLLKAITSKNKALPPRIFRRNVDDIGVPFHLEIQGLGQVNP